MKLDQHNGSEKIDSFLNKAIAEHRKGHLTEACNLYKDILRIDPSNDNALHFLGVIASQLGDQVRALELIEKAIQLNPNNEVYFSNLGNVLMQLNEYPNAIKSFERALELKPDYSDVYFNLGNIYLTLGDNCNAISAYEDALKYNPKHYFSMNNLGNIYLDEKNYENALGFFKEAVQEKSDYVVSRFNLANTLRELKIYDEAAIEYKMAIDLDINYLPAWINLAITYYLSGDYTKSLELSYELLDRDPKYFPAFINIGNIYLKTHEIDKALEAYTTAITINSNSADAYYNLGNAFKSQGNWRDALTQYESALLLAPNFIDALNNSGIIHLYLGMYEQCETVLKKALSLDPNYVKAYHNLANMYYEMHNFSEAYFYFKKCCDLDPSDNKNVIHYYHILRRVCDWSNVQLYHKKVEEITKLSQESNQITTEDPFVCITRTCDLSTQYHIARIHSDRISKQLSHQIKNYPFEHLREYTGPIRIGYISNDFFEHATMHLIQGLLRNHDIRNFEVYLYSYDNHDENEYILSIKENCYKFIKIYDDSYIDAADKIYNDNIQILIDLKGYTQGNRLEICSFKPAPLIISFLGYPGTTGSTFIDYIITDAIVTPEEEQSLYSETFLYMPDTYQCTDNFQPQLLKQTRSQNRLPENGFIYCCFNQSFKIQQELFDTWIEILSKVPNSYLWLLKDNDLMVENINQYMTNKNIPEKRVIFADKTDRLSHLSRLQLADLALDTFIYNGHTTTTDALWTNVPVLTKKGSDFSSRVSQSLLNAIGMNSLIVETEKDYIDKAIFLGNNPNHCQNLKQTIQANKTTHPLFDTQKYTQNIEKLYKQAWENFLAKKISNIVKTEES